jgi:carbamate kinase
MRIVVALGGNALLERGEKPDSQIQLHRIHAAVAALAPIATGNEVIITHGNGPQSGCWRWRVPGMCRSHAPTRSTSWAPRRRA